MVDWEASDYKEKIGGVGYTVSGNFFGISEGINFISWKKVGKNTGIHLGGDIIGGTIGKTKTWVLTYNPPVGIDRESEDDDDWQD